eukprot:15454566-Alexandrium_andersonii.AAC.1
MRGLRIIAGNPPEGPVSTRGKTDCQVLEATGAQHVETRLWKSRLTYLARMTAHAGPTLNAVVQATPCLRQQVVDDLSTLHRLTPKLSLLPPPFLTLCLGSCSWSSTLLSGAP